MADARTPGTGRSSNLRGWASFPESLPDFDPDEAPSKPSTLFLTWLADAGEYGLAPHAATLSTVDTGNLPDARVVILKDVDASGWYVASSAASPKGVQLASNPRAALTFFWPERGRQVRLRGRAEPAAPAVSAGDFANRPFPSKVEAFIGNQSEILTDPRELESAASEAERLLAENPDLVPGEWTRYLIAPRSVEFWQARHDRRHIRLRYQLNDGDWARERLWP